MTDKLDLITPRRLPPEVTAARMAALEKEMAETRTQFARSKRYASDLAMISRKYKHQIAEYRALGGGSVPPVWDNMA